MKSYKLLTMGSLLLSLNACVTPEPTLSLCRDSKNDSQQQMSDIIISSAIKGGTAPKIAADYNKLVQAGTTDFLLLLDGKNLAAASQTKRNLLALGYEENDIQQFQLRFNGEDEVASCIEAVNALNQMSSFDAAHDRKLFILTQAAEGELPLLGVLYDRFILRRNLIASYKERVCSVSGLTCSDTFKSQSFYRLTKSMEQVSEGRWMRDAPGFCADLKDLDSQDLKFVKRYLNCETEELSAMSF